MASYKHPENLGGRSMISHCSRIPMEESSSQLYIKVLLGKYYQQGLLLPCRPLQQVV